MRRSPTFLLVAAMASACSGTAETPTTASNTTTPTSTALATSTAPTTSATSGRPDRCPNPSEADDVGRVSDPELDEISGAAVSRSRPGVIWVHNDSGADPVVYALDASGTIIDRVSLPDLSARDWEDMAIGPGPRPDTDYLFLADIGDNQATRDEVQIHRVPEPLAGSRQEPGGETLHLTYPTGPLEAETLLVDEITGDMVIAGKSISGATRLLTVAGTADWSQPQQATLIGEIQLGTFAPATGGDADAGRIVIRTYDEVFQWERSPGLSLAETLLGRGCRVASVSEQQGEAIALVPGGFYTLSEGIDQPIHLFAPSS